MIQTRNIVIFLSLASALAEVDPEPIFKAIGGELEMGFCFGDHIAVYRLTSEKRELLGQSSSPSISPPDAFKGRITISNDDLLFLKISDLQFSDSGTYISECRSGNTMENYRKHYLYVCNEDSGTQRISLAPGTGADLECNMGSKKHVTVKWFRGAHNMSLFMDTQISLEPLQAEYRSLISVHDKGSFLHVSDGFIQDRPNFVCLVMEEGQCRSFQTIELPEQPEMKNVYRSVGENVILTCSVDHLRQSYWETPFGQVNSSAAENQITLSTSRNSEDYSLVIHSLTSTHSGSYKCFSTLLIEEYIVNVCPLLDTTDISFSAEDKNVVLQCDFMSLPALSDKAKHTSVLWFRNTGGQDMLIMDSEDPYLTNDLQGRLNFSPMHSSLIFTDPKKEDSGTYWCVVLLDDGNDDGDDDDDDDDGYDDGGTFTTNDSGNEEDEVDLNPMVIEDEEYMDMCLFKQVINLKFQSVRRKSDSKSKSGSGSGSGFESESEPEPKPESSLTTYAVCAGLGGLLALALLVGIVMVIKRAKKRSASVQGKGLELSHNEQHEEPLNPQRDSV